MSVDAQMTHLWWRFWWAAPHRRFMFPGLYVWAFRRNIRLIPFPQAKP